MNRKGFMGADTEEKKELTDRIKSISLFFIILLAAAVLGSYFAGRAGKEEVSAKSPADAGVISVYSPVTDNDMIVSKEGAIPISEELLDKGPLTGGAYIISGDYGRTVVIDAHDEIVHLILDGANIRTNDGPAILARSAAKVIITAKEGTENNLADCAYYSERNIYAAVFSYADVTINGKGILNISGFSKDAIHTQGFFKVLDTDIRLKAKRTALNADDGMLLSASFMSTEAEKTGLKSGIHNKVDKGSIYISGGDNTIIAGNTGIYSGRDLYVSGCTLSINAVVSDIVTEGEQYIEDGCL